MTYETDPVRWTSSPDEAPEGLGAPLRAAQLEGPSAVQMRSLALKLSAVAAGAALAATAGTAHASTTAASATTAAASAGATASLPLVKLVVASLALGAAALGGTMMWPKSPVHTEQEVAAPASSPIAPNLSPLDAQAGEVEADLGPGPQAAAEVEPRVDGVRADDRVGSVRKPATARGASRARERATEPTAATPKPSVRNASTERRQGVASRAQKTQAERAQLAGGKTEKPSEVELLRKARTALSSSPREAFALTEAHREHYPQGVFAQERDALAIEALMRAGDMTAARRLARRFVDKFPSSPHAHRFREAMGLH
jgi:hypothetical protein